MKWNQDLTPYKITTDRLVIKCWEPKYAEQLRDEIVRSSDSLLPWMPFAKPPIPSIEQQANVIRMFRGNYDLGNDYTLGIFTPSEEIAIGSTGLHTRQGQDTFEIGYWIGKDYQGNGYATEVAIALIKTAFELSNIDRLEINTVTENAKSLSVIKKLNVIYEETVKNNTQDAYGNYHDSQKWSLTRDNYSNWKFKDFPIKWYSITGKEISNNI